MVDLALHCVFVSSLVLAFVAVSLQEAPYVFQGNFAEYEIDVKKRGFGVELSLNDGNSK